MTTIIPSSKTYTGEGFKYEKLLAFASVTLVVLSILSNVMTIRAMSLQHKQISNQMKKDKESDN
jgi:hypothetical protein